jgi:hypothetical protein
MTLEGEVGATPRVLGLRGAWVGMPEGKGTFVGGARGGTQKPSGPSSFGHLPAVLFLGAD